jgi:hypothetical protein
MIGAVSDSTDYSIPLRILVALTTVGLSALAASSQSITPSEQEFFESRIRPVLVQNCYSCHGGDPDELKSNLHLTYRDGVRNGGDRGPAIVSGDPDASILIKALRYRDPDLQMPPTGQLAPEKIADFEAWVRMGAPDPRVDVPSNTDLQAETSWEAIIEQRKQWWSFLPITNPEPPANAKHPVDAFIRHSLEEAGLAPAPRATDSDFLRRLYFILIGLPPTPEEMETFLQQAKSDRTEAVGGTVDRLLASPRFGERWARHWMDWIRYTETHGNENDPAIPHAWRYRDYLIRALNDDIRFDQLVREHLAGDLLDEPRINHELGVNESVLGTAQYRFVQHGYSPTDALEEQTRFVENQVDVITKGFMGVTVSCARCHNHKFDPISQEDYYALYGVMASTRPATITVDEPDRLTAHRDQLNELKNEIRDHLATEWLSTAGRLAETLLDPPKPWRILFQQPLDEMHPLHVWQQMRKIGDPDFVKEWYKHSMNWERSVSALKARYERDYLIRWDLSTDDADQWFRHGNGLLQDRSPAGEFNVLVDGEQIVDRIYPGGFYSHGLSSKHSAILSSPRFQMQGANLYARIIGSGGAVYRYTLHNYPQMLQLYPGERLSDESWRWQRFDTTYWDGDSAHIEISTAPDQPMHARQSERSWFGITEVVLAGESQPPPHDELAEFVSPLFEQEGRPGNAEELAQRYADALTQCIEAWRDGNTTGNQARFLNAFVSVELLPNVLDELETVRPLVETFRELEAQVPVPIRAPGIIQDDPIDQPLFTRGDHRSPEDPVARRFLEAIDSTPYGNEGQGRLELAEDILREDNPLTPRVIVNRLWSYVFGRGIVATSDNFGALGETPTHPELLDYLAAEFVQDDWSIKEMIRRLVTSETFAQSFAESPEAGVSDPDNRLLSHANVRRLEAETIRDSIFYAAGRLDERMYGRPTSSYVGRRSVYLEVQRNSLEPLLAVFDAPVPITTQGRRIATNVPAQSLMLMNDELVADLALSLSRRVLDDPTLKDDRARVDRLFQIALSRPASDAEITQAIALLEAIRDEHKNNAQAEKDSWEDQLDTLDQDARKLRADLEKRWKFTMDQLALEGIPTEDKGKAYMVRRVSNDLAATERKISQIHRRLGEPDPWPELAHSIFNSKELIYFR